jgi:hypothetical protein
VRHTGTPGLGSRCFVLPLSRRGNLRVKTSQTERLLLQHTPTVRRTSLLCLSGCTVQLATAQTPCPTTYANFTPRGDLPDPDGGETALDSAWSLRKGSIADGSGDPGRMLGEARKEARDTHCKFNEFVAYHQVKFYRQGPPARQSLYPRIHSW